MMRITTMMRTNKPPLTPPTMAATECLLLVSLFSVTKQSNTLFITTKSIMLWLCFGRPRRPRFLRVFYEPLSWLWLEITNAMILKPIKAQWQVQVPVFVFAIP